MMDIEARLLSCSQRATQEVTRSATARPPNRRLPPSQPPLPVRRRRRGSPRLLLPPLLSSPFLRSASSELLQRQRPCGSARQRGGVFQQLLRPRRHLAPPPKSCACGVVVRQVVRPRWAAQRSDSQGTQAVRAGALYVRGSPSSAAR